jgi:clan AA aspartic protease
VLRRALLTLSVRADDDSDIKQLVAWIDTAFDGDLVFPLEAITTLELSQAAAVSATLADGTATVLETFDCLIDWFGEWRNVQVISNEGNWALLGTSLLRDRRFVIDYRSGNLALE